MGYWEDFEAFEAKADGELNRGFIYKLPDPTISPAAPAAYRHQLETLVRIEHGGALSPPLSGIVHLPTGSGKTRIALELVARTLEREPNHRFLWATESRLLIQQTMKRAVEFAARFPKGTRIAWYEGDPDLLDEEGIHLTFLTRSHLRTELSWAHDGRSIHPWRRRVDAGEPLTLIYDECHQLGSQELQKSLTHFYKKVVTPAARRHRWRLIGLSATPLPTKPEAQTFLRDAAFPLHPTAQSVGREWGMHVFHRVDNNELINEGVLCPLNMSLDRSGVFDIPPEMLRRIAGDERVAPPGPNARKDEVIKYSRKFNQSVMGHESVVRFLAEKLAKNLDAIGKTIVFVPTIPVANRLVAALSAHPKCAGKVAAVHSKMSEYKHAVPGQDAHTPEQVLSQFRARGTESCILVNVEMLTEGFDDPKVRTVVLAKLTLSTNRFWQMIGRGTRGTKAGGTTDCYVIDPIKLVRLYDYFGGYQPRVDSKPGTAIEDLPEDGAAGALSPVICVLSHPPPPSEVRYTLSPELLQTHAAVARAIESFLHGGPLGEQEAIDISHGAVISPEDGGVVVRPGTGAIVTETGLVLLRETLNRMKVRMQVDLAWVDRQVPTDLSDDTLRFWIRKLKAIEELSLRTEDEYARAEMDGRLARALAVPVASAEDMGGRTPPVAKPQDDQSLADITNLCAAVARADGVLVDAEVEVSVRVIGRITGALDTTELRSRTAGLTPTTTQCSDSVARLASAFDTPKRKALLRGLLEVAASDGYVHPEEVQVLVRTAEGLGISRDYVDALLDARDA